jgi:hypothetical protein
MADFTFKLTPKNCEFTINNIQKLNQALADGNFDIEDIDATLIYQVEITPGQVGISDVVLSGRMQGIAATLKIWGDEEDSYKPVSFDTSQYDVQFDLDFNEYKQLIPTEVEIDVITKIIRVS